MRFSPILFVVATLVITILGCGSKQSAQQNTASGPVVTREPATQAEMEELGKDPLQQRIEELLDNWKKNDSLLAVHPGLLDLLSAASDESDSEGRLIAISLYNKNLKLSDLAESTSLQRLNAGHAELTDADMAVLPKLTGLEKLELNVNPGITDAGLKHLQGLVKLRFLSLFFCPQLTGAGFAQLTELDNLVILDIGNNKNITDDSLKYLQELENLQVLHARPLWGVTDAGLKHISKISDLRRLQFKSKLVTDRGMEYLTDLKKLEILVLDGCEKLTDQGLQHLAELKNLEAVSFVGCEKLTDEGIQKLQQTLPDCRIVRQPIFL